MDKTRRPTQAQPGAPSVPSLSARRFQEEVARELGIDWDAEDAAASLDERSPNPPAPGS